MRAPFYSNQQLFHLIRSGRMSGSLSTISIYLVVVSPGDEICEKVRQLKDRMRSKLRGNQSLNSKAHFTIINLPAPYCLEGRIIAALARACGSIATQPVTIDGFGNFSNGDGKNVIYLKTAEELFFAQIQRQTKLALRAEGLKRRYAHLSGKAHITVAKDLSDASFNYWLPEMSREIHRYSFQASELFVLKRRPGGYTKCEVIERIPFTGNATPVIKSTVRQTCLF